MSKNNITAIPDQGSTAVVPTVGEEKKSETLYASPDTTITKLERFDADLASFLLNSHDALGCDDKDALKRYYRKRSGQHVRVDYKAAEKVRKEGHWNGRLYPMDGVGYACLPNKIRSSLAHQYYWDVDMQQAHLSIFTQLCEKAGLSVPCMRNVLSKRDEYFEWGIANNMDKDDIKMAITCTLFGGTPTGAIHDSPLWSVLQSFQDECRMAVTFLKTTMIYETSVAKRRKGNFIGAFINLVCCNVERNVLMIMDSFFTSKGYPVDSLIYDGCMIRKKEGEPSLPHTLLSECEASILAHTGYTIKLVVKPMVPSFSIPTDTEIEAKMAAISKCHMVPLERVRTLTNKYITSTVDGKPVRDADVAPALAHMMMGTFVWDATMDTKTDQFILYKWNGVYWQEVTDKFMADVRTIVAGPLRSFLSDIEDLAQMVCKGKRPMILYSPNAGCVKKQADCIYATKCVKDLCFYGPWNGMQDYVQFDNCLYDIINHKIYTEGVPELYINRSNMVQLKVDSSKIVADKARLRAFTRSLFEHDEDEQWLWKFLASCARKHNTEQLGVFFTGVGGNGKGSLTSLLERAFGTEYGNLNMAYYTERQSSGADVNLFETRHSRIIMSVESSAGDKFLDGKFKSITGGDTIKTRTNYDTKETTFVAGRVIIQTNNLPQFTCGLDEALSRRIAVLRFPYQFRRPELFDPNDPYHRRADQELCEWLKTDAALAAFWATAIDFWPVYKTDGLAMTQSMVRETNTYKSELDVLGCWLEENLEYKHGMRVKVTDLCSAFNMTGNDRVNPIVFGRRLKGTKYTTIISHQAAFVLHYQLRCQLHVDEQ